MNLIHIIKSIALIEVPKCPEPANLTMESVFRRQIKDNNFALSNLLSFFYQIEEWGMIKNSI